MGLVMYTSQLLMHILVQEFTYTAPVLVVRIFKNLSCAKESHCYLSTPRILLVVSTATACTFKSSGSFLVYFCMLLTSFKQMLIFKVSKISSL